jgi:hypothetical protein
MTSIAVGENIGISGGLGEIEIDMNGIVIARRAAIERQLVAADRREGLVDDAVADGELIAFSLMRPPCSGPPPCGSSRRRGRRAGWSPLVSTKASVIAPPFLSVMPAMRGSKRRVSPTITGAL